MRTRKSPVKPYNEWTPEEWMSDGHRLLNTDLFEPAYSCFKNAHFAAVPGSLDDARAFHMMGICERLLGNTHAALVDFETASEMAGKNGDLLLKSKVMRDESMAHHDRDNLFKAITCAEASIQLAEQIGAPKEELGASLGFLARHYAVSGNLQDALSKFYDAHDLLRAGDNRHYELNNLVWLIKSTPAKIRLRPKYCGRAIWLALKGRRPRRLLEVFIGLAGARAYEFAKKLYKK